MNKKGASLISITLSVVAISLVVAALVVTINNTNEYYMAKKDDVVIDNLAYVKVYTKSEIEAIVRQAFVDNYLSYYDKEVDLEGLEALVLSDVQKIVPEAQLENYDIVVTADGVDVIE